MWLGLLSNVNSAQKQIVCTVDKEVKYALLVVMSLKKICVAVLTCFVATGCYEVSMDFAISEDGSGTADIELLFDVDKIVAIAEAFDATDELPASRSELCDELLSDFEEPGDPFEFSLINTSAQCGVAGTFSWQAGATEIVPDGSVLVEVDGDLINFRMGFDDFVPTDDGLDPEMASMVGAVFTLNVSADMPGDVIEHNGTLSGQTVTWELDLMSPSVDELYATSQPSQGGFPTAIVIVVAVLLLLVGVGVVQKSRSEPPSET